MPVAPRLQNLGVHTFPVSTKVKQAQLFINQGVNLAYAFNHAEAARAFAEAARLDPQNPMAYWGHALVLGPNINATMNPEDEPKALALAQKAASLKARATPRERAYIDAVLARYTGKPEDRAQANLAFANAMRTVVAAVSRRCRRANDLRRVVDEPAAVELLDARRCAVRRDSRSRSRVEPSVEAASQSSGCAPLVDPLVGADRYTGARRG